MRFLLGGALNTIVTYTIYLALTTILGYQWAYFFAYILGILFAYWINAVFVFRVGLSMRGLVSFPLVYVVQYIVSALLLGALVEFASINEKFAPLIVIICVVPLTYVIAKLVLFRTYKREPK